MPSCKDCLADGITTNRPTPHPGPRCATHHRAVVKERKARAHAKRIADTYGGLTGDEYRTILAHQGGRCAICQWARGTGKKKLAIDHDHKTGLVRGLLCSQCNYTVLGRLARDGKGFFMRGWDYLDKPPAKQLGIVRYGKTNN